VKIKQRFSRKEAPLFARRQLPFIKQHENESIEEFALRVYFFTLDGNESCEGNIIEEIAMETFLRSWRNKQATMKARERERTDNTTETYEIRKNSNSKQAYAIWAKS
jgi:hypothetical protein